MTRRPLYGSNQRRRSIREFWNLQEEIAKEQETDELVGTPQSNVDHQPTYTRNVLFTFSTATLSKTNRVQFFYALKGRGRKRGMVDQLGADHLGPGAIMVPGNFSGAMERFLQRFTTDYSRLDFWIEKPSRKMRIRQAFDNAGKE